jgi:hypothetical protein
MESRVQEYTLQSRWDTVLMGAEGYLILGNPKRPVCGRHMRRLNMI